MPVAGPDHGQGVIGLPRGVAEPEQREADLLGDSDAGARGRHGTIAAGNPTRGRAAVPRSGHRSGRGGPEPVLEIEDDALRALTTDTRHLRQGCEVLRRDRTAHAVRAVDAEHGLGKSGTDPGGSLQGLEDVALVGVGKTVEGQLGLPDDQRGDQPRVLPDP